MIPKELLQHALYAARKYCDWRVHPNFCTRNQVNIHNFTTYFEPYRFTEHYNWLITTVFEHKENAHEIKILNAIDVASEIPCSKIYQIIDNNTYPKKVLVSEIDLIIFCLKALPVLNGDRVEMVFTIKVNNNE